ncbi:MAG TPA: type II secretion system protein N [Allosphingosinicella sp.]|nr:type II secretion system protein N [Allosphingosinicella sp.]
MRRIRLDIGRAALFLAAFAFAMVALIPLRIATGWVGGGLAAREASGSIWLGMLKEARFGPVPLGDLKARLNVLPLFIGRARLSLSRESEGQGPFEGAVTVSRHAFGLEDATGMVRTGPSFAPLPIAALDLTDVSVHFAEGLCESAEGRVRATLSGELAGVALAGGMSGVLRCAGGALLVPLASESGIELVNLSLRADGAYRADIVIRQNDPGLAARMAGAGFRAAPQGYTRRVEGHF